MFLLLFFFLILSVKCSAIFDDSEFSPAIAERKLANKHLVMVGDSLMRYQYLALVYSLKFGVKLTDSDTRNFVREHTFSDWFDYFSATNSLLCPNEYCDCFKTTDSKYDTQFENRFYEDREKHIKITFLLMYGKFNQGHWSNTTDDDGLRKPSKVYTPAVWKTDLPDTLTGFLRQMVDAGDRNSSVLVLNAGHHVHHFLESEYCDKVISRAVGLFGQVIWKTTSCQTRAIQKAYELAGLGAYYLASTNHSHDNIMCSKEGVKCLDISWITEVPDEDYIDPIHYRAPVYNVINTQMMKLIEDLNESSSMNI